MSDEKPKIELSSQEVIEICDQKVKEKTDAEERKTKARIDYNERISHHRKGRESKGYARSYAEGYDAIDWGKK